MGSISPVLSPEERKLSGKARERAIARCRVWKLEVSCGVDKSGKRIRHTKTVHGTKSEAKKELVKFEAKYGARQIEDISLEACCQDYMRRKEGTIAESSYNAMASRIRVIYYIFGRETKLSKLTPDKIDEGMKELLTKGGEGKSPCKPSYVGSIHAALASVLLDAFRHGHLATDPIPDTKYYSAKAPKREIPPTRQLTSILSRIDPRDYRQMAVALILSLGLRRQEAAALRWDDITEDRIYIRRSVRTRAGGEYVVEMTKSDAGRRELPIPSFLPTLLEKRRQALEDDIDLALRSKIISERPDPLYVCANRLGGRPSLSSLTKWWCQHRSGLGVTCSLHDLRHNFASMLAEQNIHPSTGAALLGHGVDMLLQIYTHPQWDKSVEAVETIEALFPNMEMPPDDRARVKREKIVEAAEKRLEAEKEAPF